MNQLRKQWIKQKLDIEITSPTLIVPFKQGTQEEIDKSERWEFTIPAVNFKSKDDGDDLDIKKRFELRMANVSFYYVN